MTESLIKLGKKVKEYFEGLLKDKQCPFFEYFYYDIETPCEDALTGKKYLNVRFALGGFDDAEEKDIYAIRMEKAGDMVKIKEVFTALKKQGPCLFQTPQSSTVTDSLKDFQKSSVNYIFNKLYNESKRRFLVADEVGLGKTLIAKGVVARAISHLWDKKESNGAPLRIDIIYICSNSAIASQNINKITIPGVTGHISPTRITMLPLQVQDFDSRLNFIALTPGTSFNLTGGTGLKSERAVILYIAKEIWGFNHSKTMIDLFRDSARHDNFAREFEYIKSRKLNQTIINNFAAELKTGYPQAEADFKKLVALVRKYRTRKSLPDAVHNKRREFIITLRRYLAKAAVRALEPDLIILDEFQRFKDLLGDPREGALEIQQREVRELFNNLLEFGDAKVLLLSATPYKMYTLHEEAEYDHYSDFLDTTRFLLHDDEKLDSFKQLLGSYRETFLSGDLQYNPGKLTAIREKIETVLRECMIRTERFRYIKNNDGLIDDGQAAGRDMEHIAPADIKAYAALEAIVDVLKGGNVLEYWKSSPFLFNLMEDYKSKGQFIKLLQAKPESHVEISANLNDLIDFEKLENYEQIDINNARIRHLMENVFDQTPKMEKILWIPPTIKYWEPASLYKDASITKTLVFSRWRVAPKAIGLLLSYEAERRIFKDTGKRYFDEKKVNPIINFSEKGDQLNGMNNFTFLYPCYTLAEAIDPLAICSLFEKLNHRLPSIEELVAVTANELEKKYSTQLGASRYKKDSTKQSNKWYWSALSILDKQDKTIGSDLKFWHFTGSENFFDKSDTGSGQEAKNQVATGLDKHVKQLDTPMLDDLKGIPVDFWQVMAKIALGSPAVIMLRCLFKLFPNYMKYVGLFMFAASQVAFGFRSLFNGPDAIMILRGMGEDSYWEQVLDYSIEGNLQAVMDEYVHVFHDVNGLVNKGPVKGAFTLAEKISAAVSLRTSTGKVDHITVDDARKTITILGNRILRYNFAMPFGQNTESEDKTNRDENVRNAFNSPFRPFVLASTSIGQEGLDFHLYCHSLWHWNLPGNPVDLEQREGRINRYKGHLIRRNIVDKINPRLSDFTGDLWNSIFLQAEKTKQEQDNDLIPYWIFEHGSHKLRRHVPALLMGKELQHYEDLKRTLVLYRMVFGQPRQQDLLEYLQSVIDPAILERLKNEMMINLSPVSFVGRGAECE